MSYPQYPAGLPLPNDNLSGEIITAVSRTEMDGGQTRQIARFSTGQKTIGAQFTLTSSEYVEFQTFFYSTLNNGVDWFELNLPTEDGFQIMIVRFVGGRLTDAYRTFDNWNVSATLESFINQLISAPDFDLQPIWFQPEREILIDTVLDSRFANNLLVCAPSSGETIKLTVPEIGSPSDWLPFGVINKGPGNVTITIAEDVVPPEPSDTWMALAASMGAWGIYRFDTGATLDFGGRLEKIADLSANGNDLKDTFATHAQRAEIVGGWCKANASDNSCFRGYQVDGSDNSIMSLSTYHILVVQRINLPATDGRLITIKQQPSPTTDNTTAITSQTGPGRWGVIQNTINGSIASDRNYPTSGSTPRLMEIISYTTKDINFIINGFCISSYSSPNSIMDCLQLGGVHGKTNATANCSTAAAVIFSDVSNLGSESGRLDLAYLREKMLSDFS